MAKPNYSFEKRQRELAKKKKKEEKAKERADRKANPHLYVGIPETPDEPDGADAADGDTPDTPAGNQPA